MKKSITRDQTLTAMFLALGLVLPLLTGQIKQVGNMLLPMHIPVLLCGLICGWKYGGAVGLILPPLRYLIFGMPVIFPTGIAMALELCAYGLISGVIYAKARRRGVPSLYLALVTAMVGGRLVWGAAMLALMGLSGGEFTWALFLGGALLNAIPGIIIQLMLIPAVMVALDRTGMVKFSRD